VNANESVDILTVGPVGDLITGAEGASRNRLDY
jgi:hypothetical protein